MTKLRNILLTLACAFAAFGCQLRPLEEPGDVVELKVVVNVKSVLNVTEGIYNSKIPVPTISTGMIRVLFYDPATGQQVGQAFLSEETVNSRGETCLGGSIEIKPGTYDMICYNFDTRDTFVRGDVNRESLQSYTGAVSSQILSRYGSLSAGTGSVNYTPEHFIVSRDMNLRISPHTGTLVIETEATTIIDTYYIQVRVEGVQYASAASAVLSGMAPSNHFGIAQRDDDPTCGVYFELMKSTDENIQAENKDVLCTTFNTYGKVYHDGPKAQTKADSELSITFNVVSGSKSYDYTFDMNDIFDSEDAIKRHWLLINKTIVVPEPDPGPSGGGGFNPEVGPWEHEEGEIII